MKDLERSFNNIQEAKKISLGFKAQALQQLVLQRIQSLTTISAITFAIAGITLSFQPDLLKNKLLGILATLELILVALISLGRHLYLIRSDIKSIAKKIEYLPEQNWEEPLEKKEFQPDFWPETLYGCLIIGICLFCISLFDNQTLSNTLANMPNLLTHQVFINTTGLVLNTIAAIILIVPNLKRTRNIDDDYIVSMDKKTGNYTQKKHLREQRINITGLILLAVGFCLQLIATLF